ncbi:hypothetical protein CGCTS75_v005364 [Colletotrichum tropicale]|nr:hypothetical protein CGCTS75_v005364 [Colletotrichum tropicale]
MAKRWSASKLTTQVIIKVTSGLPSVLRRGQKGKTHQHTFNMPFFYSKPIGGKNFGTSVHADRHGIRRGPWRFRIGRFNCFR